jgi:hypothetical protein
MTPLAHAVNEFGGPSPFWGLLATVAALADGFLLLMDSNVRDYLESLKKRQEA